MMIHLILTASILLPVAQRHDISGQASERPDAIGNTELRLYETGHVTGQGTLGNTELRVYEIGHLTGQNKLDARVSETIRSHGMQASKADHVRLGGLEHLTGRVQSTTESISNAIRGMLEPAFDDSHNKLTDLGGGTLAIIASEEQHVWLDRLIALASDFDGMVVIQARIYILEKGSLAKVAQERSGQVVSDARAEKLLADLENISEGGVIAPRVQVYPFQQAELTVLDQHAYVQDYELSIKENVEVAEPVIGIAESGIRMRFRCIPGMDEVLSIDAHVEHSTLIEPIPSIETAIGAMAGRVTIQLPEITKVTLNGRFELLPGQTLVMASTDPVGEQEVIVLVSATRVAVSLDEE